MKAFKVEITKCTVSIQTMYTDFYNLCDGFYSQKDATFSVLINYDDIQKEKYKYESNDKENSIKQIDYSDAYYEITAVQRKIAERFFEYNTLLFHGSVVALDGEAFLFTAKSGTGKSTHTRFWREVFGSRAVMINDDKPFLKINDDGVTVYGSPWNGKHRLGSNTSAPLKAICILERGTENHISEISAKEALPMLLQQSHRPMRMSMMPHYLDLIDQLSQKVRFYRLSCTMDPQAAVVAYEGMTNKGKEEV